MKGNSKKRLLINLVTVICMMCLFFTNTVTAFAATQISTIRVNVAKNDWEQVSNNPKVTVDGKGYKVDESSVKFSKKISDCIPGEKIVVEVKLVSEEGYFFKDSYKEKNFKISNGTYKNHSYEGGNILLKIAYTVRGKSESPDEVYWDGTIARWNKVSDKVNYSLKLCKNNKSKLIAENISTTKYDLSEYLKLADYFEKDNVYFKVKAVPKKSYENYIEDSEYIESDEFSDWDELDVYENGCNKPNNPHHSNKNGWRNVNNSWYYYENGKAYSNGFKAIDGKMYYFFDNGIMATGWQKIANKWYVFDQNGSLYTNTWYNDRGTWYFIQGTGVMKTGWLDWNGNTYYLNSSGAMVTGWQYIEGNWYYFNVDGTKVSNTYILSADRTFSFYMNPDGKMYTGWMYQNGWRYVEPVSGNLHRGWLNVNNCTYYIDPTTAVMLTGFQKIDGKEYYFYENGILAK